MNFNDIKKLNEIKIKDIKSNIEKNPQDESLKKRFILQNKIQELFEKDESLFFNITIDEAFQILKQILNESDSIKDVYIELTSPEEYVRTLRKRTSGT